LSTLLAGLGPLPREGQGRVVGTKALAGLVRRAGWPPGLSYEGGRWLNIHSDMLCDLGRKT
jgi:hypothetical protein